MFKAIILFLEIATGAVSPLQSQSSFPSQQQCEEMVAHDVPILQARATRLFPGEYEISGKCIPVPDKDDGSI